MNKIFLTYRTKQHRQLSIDDLYNTGNLDINIYSEEEHRLRQTRTIQIEGYKHKNDKLLNKFTKLTQELIILNKVMVDKTRYYKTFHIPKRTGGYREINAPEPQLMFNMRVIKNVLEKDLELLHHDNAFAYVKERDVNKAMQRHLENKSRWFLKVDIKKFFNNCNSEFIKEQLKQVHPFSYLWQTNQDLYNRFADELTKLACLNNELPQGTPLSPILTNLLMIPFDYTITRMLWKDKERYSKTDKEQTYVYTRYADDIIISGRESFNYVTMIKDINTILKDYPFELKEEKTRYGSNAGRNWNLGLMYNKDLNVTIGHRRKKQIKAGIHNFVTRTERWSLEDLRVLLGEISYMKNIEPKYTEGVLLHYSNTNYDTVTENIINEIKSYNN